MNYQIRLLDEARLDIKDIIIWYNNVESGLGRRFYGSLKSSLDYIRKYPFNSQIVYRDIRNMLLKKFPYQVHYRVIEQDKLIIVFAITHTSRNPRVWLSGR
ncbi:type II toxin-antitoxin system RelE/ParE family toxin [Algoriphagus terrigena]|uniref:type II toxin-antitoxin system RelE/ParE family toxin n=1 Tax=Algoriphagus terrigena TaxID=344884 RepID=UPI000A0056DE|nr:type II toxin-antitoxin system RelE/ParE family toxin [Algoriphagus terrigena]